MEKRRFLFVSLAGLIGDIARGREAGQRPVAGPGASGEVLTVVGTDATMKDAQRQAYARVRNILIPNMNYRDDIGDRWQEDSDRLFSWSYLRRT